MVLHGVVDGIINAMLNHQLYKTGWLDTVGRVTVTFDQSFVSSSPIKDSLCFLELDTFSSGWFQEQIRTRFHHQTTIN